ncbi:hypothetical protein AKJ51_03295 [candidate division MSBL1 archaeon SCGC-AAA382A20]|uniref:OB domain-containing protein n=1 Tax=candidate division MSBL1 archaeon SCGC-AAA382A20 TaxID=1698280 RepID=A0A133VJM4_9EURY|nr:hypothetical protein AKJ51_03295 [candidate division MSBL1 archaeon SCGC-AAA382A20]
MMIHLKNSKMIKLSLISSLTGMILLYAGAMQMRPKLTPISQVNKDFVGLKAKISGKVIDIQKHSNEHIFLKVKDQSGGVISIPLFKNLLSDLDKRIELLDRIQATGRIKKYQGDLELIPEKANDIQIVHTTPTELSKINNEKIGEKVKVRGFIKKKTQVGAGNLLLTICKKDESLKVFAPKNVTNYGNFSKIEEGKTIQVAGTVQIYENELELKISDSYNIKIVGAST